MPVSRSDMPVSRSATIGICLRVLVSTMTPPGLLVTQQQNNVVLSATPTTQVRTTMYNHSSLQTRKWVEILLIGRFLADG